MQNTNKMNDDFDNGEIVEENYILRLFIAGASVNSVRAVKNIKHLCNTFLPDRHELEIIDIYQQPLLAEKEQIIALPLLIRKYPLPERRFVGDLSEAAILLKGLGITSKN